ncbi:signal recognition particle receptor beta subunit-domain-containing protein [Apiosordaria backusii]|uniref:Signal recognition particle receptor subunit beta n=1 Tax=Apiosordaria backusii TaxID=314023 RepID=A0AA40EGR9_9PEZI|nr:signal recognition particle receptor beta subunit-domain-containing protein [Apiosordaria backusii]
MSTLQTIKDLLEASLTPSPTVIILGLAFCLVAPILLHFLYSTATPYTTLPSVLLLGPPGAGKTALTTLLERGSSSDTLDGPVAKTHTSQVPSSIELSVNSDDPSTSYKTNLDNESATAKKFLLVDTPGHPKLRASSLMRLNAAEPTIKSSLVSDGGAKSKIKAVVFMVDAAALADGDALPSTAEYLYDVLLTLQKRFHSRGGSRAPASMPVLVAANKLDLFTALPAALVKSNLEAELGRIRAARSKGLLDSGIGQDDVDAGEEGDWLGGDGSEKFSFAQMMEFDVDVDVIGGSVIGDGPGAEKWWKWIGERV